MTGYGSRDTSTSILEGKECGSILCRWCFWSGFSVRQGSWMSSVGVVRVARSLQRPEHNGILSLVFKRQRKLPYALYGLPTK